MPKINRYWNSDPDSLVEREPPQTYDLCKSCECINQLLWKEKMLKRALWLARSKRAFAEYFFWNHIAFDKKYAKNKFTIYHSNSTNRNSNKVSRTPREWSDFWYDVEFKCNAYAGKLAKEYK